jgi:hypothetical protein
MLSHNLQEESIEQIVGASFVSCMGLLGIYGFYRFLGTIIISENHIILSRFGWQKQLDFKDIKHIENRKWERALILHSANKSVRIEKQLRGYGLVHDVILQKTKHLDTKKAFLTFPIILHGDNRHNWWIGGIFLLFLFLSIQVPSEREVRVLFFLLGLGWLCLWLGVLAHLITKITLLPKAVNISSLFTTIEIPTSALIKVIADKEYAPEKDPFYNLEITFDEWDIRELQKAWSFIAKRLWQNYSNLSQAKVEHVIVLPGDFLNLDLKEVCIFMRQNYLNEMR